ncbi:MAG TPA: hypothetical protein VIM48_05175 [Chthoniobacterales bacterium]
MKFQLPDGLAFRSPVDSSQRQIQKAASAGTLSTLQEDGDFHLSWTIPSPGFRTHVILEVSMKPAHMLDSSEIAEAIQNSCGSYFQYALSSKGPKTFIGGLEDRNGRHVGDVVASFSPEIEEAVGI